MQHMHLLASLDAFASLAPHRTTCRRSCANTPAAIVRCGHTTPSATRTVGSLGPPWLSRHELGPPNGGQRRSYTGHRRPDAIPAAHSRPAPSAGQPARRVRSTRSLQAHSAAARDAASARDSAAATVSADAAIDVRSTTDLSDQVHGSACLATWPRTALLQRSLPCQRSSRTSARQDWGMCSSPTCCGTLSIAVESAS